MGSTVNPAEMEVTSFAVQTAAAYSRCAGHFSRSFNDGAPQRAYVTAPPRHPCSSGVCVCNLSALLRLIGFLEDLAQHRSRLSLDAAVQGMGIKLKIWIRESAVAAFLESGRALLARFPD
jgi:hypothetical protein